MASKKQLCDLFGQTAVMLDRFARAYPGKP
jgi:hypothetical protein